MPLCNYYPASYYLAATVSFNDALFHFIHIHIDHLHLVEVEGATTAETWCEANYCYQYLRIHYSLQLHYTYESNRRHHTTMETSSPAHDVGIETGKQNNNVESLSAATAAMATPTTPTLESYLLQHQEHRTKEELLTSAVRGGNTVVSLSVSTQLAAASVDDILQSSQQQQPAQPQMIESYLREQRAKELVCHSSLADLSRNIPKRDTTKIAGGENENDKEDEDDKKDHDDDGGEASAPRRASQIRL